MESDPDTTSAVKRATLNNEPFSFVVSVLCMNVFTETYTYVYEALIVYILCMLLKVKLYLQLEIP